MNARLFWNLFKYCLAFGLLGYVVYANWDPVGGNGLKDVWARHAIEGKPIHYGFLFLAIAIYTVSLLLTFVRWYLLVRAQDLPFTLSGAMRYGLIGFFYNTFLPGSIGGDIVKAAAIARQQSRRTVAVSTVLMDRAIALWGLMWFVTILGSIFWAAGWFTGDIERPAKMIVKWMMWIVGFTALVWIGLGFLPQRRADRFAGRLRWLPKVGNSLAEFWLTVWMYRLRPRSVWIAMALSWIGHVGFVLGFYCSARVLWDGSPGNPIPAPMQHFLLVPIGMMITAIPLFPGGAGIGELGFGRLYEMFGSFAANGILGSLVQRILYWVIGFVGYLVYLSTRDNAPVVTTQPEPPAEDQAEETVPSSECQPA